MEKPKTLKNKIIIVDDHNLFRNGIKFLLSEIPDIEIVAEASDGKEFLDIIKVITPDIVLMDINMPVMNGVEATKRALELYPDLKILVLSMFSDEEYYNTMIDLGVKGFILKDADNEELKNAVRRVISGNTYFSQDLLVNLIKNKHSADNVSISGREKEVLILICKGYSTGEIATELNLSMRTVERHRSSLLEKTNSNNSIKLVLFAIKNNLVKI